MLRGMIRSLVAAPRRLFALSAIALLLTNPIVACAQSDPPPAEDDTWDIVDSTDGETTLIRHDSLSGPGTARQFEAEHRYADGTADRAILIADCVGKTLSLQHLDELTDGKVTNSIDATPEMAQPHPAEGKASTEGMLAYVCSDEDKAAKRPSDTR